MAFVMPVKSGEIFLLTEIVTNASKMVNKSIRTHGRVILIDRINLFVDIEYEKQSLRVSTEMISADFELRVNCLYQFIGELYLQNDALILKARIARNIDGMDLKLYKDSLQLMRKHLNSTLIV